MSIPESAHLTDAVHDPTRDCELEELLTVHDAARFLNVSVSWVYEHTRDDAEDRLPFVKLGKYVRFDPPTSAHTSTPNEPQRAPHDGSVDQRAERPLARSEMGSLKEPIERSEEWRRRPDLNRGWRFCRFREVVYRVGWLRLLVPDARRCSLVFGR